MAGAFNIFQLHLDLADALHQHTAVKFDLAFPRPAHKAATASLAFKVRPAAHQPAALKGQRRKLNLKPPGMA